MKKKVTGRLFALLMAVLMVVTATFGMTGTVGASSAMSMISVKWANPQKLKSVDKGTNCATLTANVNGTATKLYVSFPKEGGVRICTDQKGSFEPASLKPINYYDLGSGTMLLDTGDTAVKLHYNASPWYLEFLNAEGKPVHTVSSRQMYFGFKNDTMRKVKIEGSVDTGEVIYGLGERYNKINQVGSTVNLWNTDTAYHTAPATVEKVNAYTNVPILNSNKGYTLFFSTYYGGKADIADTHSDRYSMDFNGTDFDFFVYTGTPAENMTSYTNLTGRPITSPKWSFGYWAGAVAGYWQQYGRDQGAKMMEETLADYKKLGTLPAAVYAEEIYRDETVYDVANSYGVRMLAWNNPSITPLGGGWNHASLSAFFKGLSNLELPAQRSYDGTNIAGAYWGDYSNPLAKTYLIENGYKKLVSKGLSGAMIDYGEYIDEATSYYNGMKGDEMHNYYGYIYTKVIHDVFEELRSGDYVLFARAGAAGSQKWAGSFGGDQPSTFDGLYQAYLGGLNISASGYSNWGSDLGGLSGTPTPELYMRWLEFATFSPYMRTHGNGNNPWKFGKLSEDTFQSYYWLRENLKDYIYSANLMAGQSGVPIMQSMVFAFPEDKTVAKIEDQYMFGDSVMVCPALSANVNHRTVIFPKDSGLWTDYWTGKTYKGGEKADVTCAVNRIPIFLHGGSAIKINVNPNGALSEAFDQNTQAEAVLFAPTDRKTVSKYQSDAKTSYCFTTEKLGEDRYGITNDHVNKAHLLIAAGVTATEVKQDGKALKKLSARPTGTATAGYYVDYDKRQTVIVTGGDWKKVTLTDGGYYSKNLAIGGTLTGSTDAVTQLAACLIDGDPSTSWTVPGEDGVFAKVDLGSAKKVHQLKVRWTTYSPDGYKLEVAGESGNDWKTVNADLTVGGEELIPLSGDAIRYIRVSDVTWEGRISPALASVEAYGDELMQDPIPEPEEEITEDDDEEYEEYFDDEEEDEDLEDEDDEDDGDDGDDVSAGTKKKRLKRYIVEEELDWVTVAIIIAVAVVVAAAGVFFLIFFLKKRKKKKNATSGT